MQIPLITSIWRGLAGMNNSLEDVWILTKPIYLSGTPELALNHMLNSISFPIPTKFNSEIFLGNLIWTIMTHINLKIYSSND